MINGYIPLNEANDFRKGHPDINVTAMKAAFNLCQRTDEERERVFKVNSNEIYDIDKIYRHTIECECCKDWLMWDKNQEEFCRNPKRFSMKELENWFIC